MQIRITHMDFINRRMGIEIHPDATEGMLEHLDTFFSDCKARDFENIDIVCRPGMSNLQNLMLIGIADRYGASIIDRSEEGFVGTPPEGVSSSCLSSSAPDSPFGTIVYEMRFNDMSAAVERATAAVVLIGSASGIDQTSRSHLRLCVYELIMNTVEHGEFLSSIPESVLYVMMSDEKITISFRDNAELFVTGGHLHVDVKQKINNQDKRGLGLVILNKLAKELTYKRLGDWNVTTLILSSRHGPSADSGRRPTMDGITVEVIPCDIPGTVVVKPVGSLDASTAQVLEAQFSSLIEQKLTRIVIDFSRVDFVSSAGVGVLLGTVSALRSLKGDLILMSMPKHIEEVFDIINLGSFFVTVNSLEELGTVSQP